MCPWSFMDFICLRDMKTCWAAFKKTPVWLPCCRNVMFKCPSTRLCLTSYLWRVFILIFGPFYVSLSVSEAIRQCFYKYCFWKVQNKSLEEDCSHPWVYFLRHKTHLSSEFEWWTCRNLLPGLMTFNLPEPPLFLPLCHLWTETHVFPPTFFSPFLCLLIM